MSRARKHTDGLQRLLAEPAGPLRWLPRIAHDVAVAFAHIGPVVLAALALTAVTVVAFRRLRRRRLATGARLVLVGVPPEVELAAARLLWSALHDLIRPRLARLLGGQPHLSWEITAGEQGTTFKIWVPQLVPPGLLERAISSAWPGASTTTEHPAPDLELDGRAVAACELTLSGPDWFSLHTDIKPDPLNLILGQLAGLQHGQRALVQVLARPASARQQRRLRTAARRLRAGIPPTRPGRLLELLTTGEPRRAPTHDPTISPDVREVMQKSSDQLYQALVRVIVTAPTQPQADGRIHAILGAFAPYRGARVGLRRRHAHRAKRRASERRLSKTFLLGVGELAALAHLPTATGIPGLTRATARRIPAPPTLPTTGRPLGLADAGPDRPLAVSVADARQHLHILGATGAGKSTAIAQLVLADAHAGRGAVVIDPKGDLVDAILARVPDIKGPLVVIDPERSHRPVGLNVLHGHDPQLAAEHLVGTFRRMYEQFWGPRTDDILRACVLTLARDPRLTLAEIPTCLANAAWRSPLTAGLEKDEPVLAGFWRWYDELSEASCVQAVGPLLNKLRAFLLRRTVRTIVGQEKTSFSLTDILDEGGLLLARVPKGTLGEDTSRLLGGLLVARVWQEALRRSRLRESERRDCCLYVDEVHNYIALPHSFEDVLAEARGYRLSLCLAHQNLTQLPRAMADALSANARTKVIFTCSPEDARTLERHVTPELTAHDLANLARHQAACRTLNNSETLPAFTLTTQGLPDGDENHAARLREQAEQRYGSDLAWVERRLRARQLRLLAGGGERSRPTGSLTGSPMGSPTAPSPGGRAA
ncbi:MAG TPA: type IV secretion system DNA-binding domain-containing protein [Solirubrobacteraceae bacterium]|jgi:hypothetical protein